MTQPKKSTTKPKKSEAVVSSNLPTVSFDPHVLEAHRVAITAAKKIREEELPHLYGWKWYKWAHAFFTSRNKICLLTAANQISKSSTLIRKNIEWACNKELWPSLWATEPKTFWYFYPTAEIATAQFYKQWVPEFLPRGSMRDHEWYGWEVQISNGDVVAVHFRSGVSCYFRAYSQKVMNLQTSAVWHASFDEEAPIGLVDEIMARLFATGGYFASVFTATIGQEFWYRAMELRGTQEETFKEADKWTASMYDCTEYMDGSPTPWTIEKIKEREAMCTSENERLRRIMGRFVRDEGLRYSSFDAALSRGECVVPEGWRVYASVDIGSGRTASRKQASCGSVVLACVNKENTKGHVVASWRGDNIETTAGDILEIYLQMIKKFPRPTLSVYDYGSKEFGLIAARSGVSFIPADKDKSRGESILNTLFKARCLTIAPGVYDNQKLVTELMTVPLNKTKNVLDDLSDALKYLVSSVPWDFKPILQSMGTDAGLFNLDRSKPTKVLAEAPDPNWTSAEYSAWEVAVRRGHMLPGNVERDALSEEIAMWNEAYG